jgi:type IV secretory pathway VirB10-like protein
VRIQSLSRPAVIAAVSTIITVIMFAVFVSSADSGEEEEAARSGTRSRTAVVESGSTPPILREGDPFEERMEAMSRARRQARGGGRGAATEEARGSGDAGIADAGVGEVGAGNTGVRDGGVVNGGGADSLSRSRAEAMALIERMRALQQQRASQQEGAGGGEHGGEAAVAESAERRFYREQLERRRQAGAMNQRGQQGRARGEDPAERRARAVSSSPVIMNTAGSGSSSVEVTPTGNGHVDMLRAAQRMAEQRGDGDMSQMLAAMAGVYAEDMEEPDVGFEGPGRGPLGSGGLSPVGTPSGNAGYEGGSSQRLNQQGLNRQGVVQMEMPASPFEVKQGTVIPAILESAVNSDMPGGVRARTTRDVFDSRSQQHLLIPKNATLVGSSGGSASTGDNRMAIAWERVILPDGRSIDLGGQETKDGKGASGVTGDVDHHFWRRFSSALLVSAVGAGVKIATYDERGPYGYGRPDAGQVVGSAAAEQSADVATEILRRGMNVRPTVTIPAGQSFHVYVNRDIAFGSPYRPADGYQTNW